LDGLHRMVGGRVLVKYHRLDRLIIDARDKTSCFVPA
jgi:hypothetical protein